MNPIRIVIFARAPLPGLAKTRLISALGESGAAALAHKMLRHAVAEAGAANVGEVELCVTPSPEAPQWRSFLDSSWQVDWQAQGEGNLGDRLARASQRNIEAGRSVLLIGADCPMLTAEHLCEAARKLEESDAVMIPSMDGGYVLLGLKQYHPTVFHGIAWSTDTVAFETLCRIAVLRWSVAQLTRLRDIDEPSDLSYLPEGWLRHE